MKACMANLRNKFALLFGGWSDGPVHYHSILETFCSGVVYRETLIELSPLLPEDALDAEQHLEFILEHLDVKNRGFKNDFVFISDNCAVDQRLSPIMSITLIGYIAHQLNLAVKG